MAITDIRPPQHAPVPPPDPGHPHHIALLIIGALLTLLGLTVAGATAPLVAAVLQQDEQGYLTSSTERYSVDTYAITSEQLEVEIGQGLSDVGVSGPMAALMLRATSASPADEVFVGVGPRADVAAYLASVEHSELTSIRFRPFRVDYQTSPGDQVPAAPADQTFWAVSARGAGTQQIEADLRSGSWAVVVMNADGRRDVDVDLQAGVRSRFLPPITAGALTTGLALLAIGITALGFGAAGRGRTVAPTTSVVLDTGSAASLTPTPPGSDVAPVRLTARLDLGVSLAGSGWSSGCCSSPTCWCWPCSGPPSSSPR